MNAPIVLYDEARAADAYAVHVAFLTHEIMDPTLADNPLWQEHKGIARERFLAEYTRQGEALQ